MRPSPCGTECPCLPVCPVHTDGGGGVRKRNGKSTHFKRESRITCLLLAAGIHTRTSVRDLHHPHIPLQAKPLPPSLYPELQEHLKEPAVLLQLCSQPPFWTAHSSTSAERPGMATAKRLLRCHHCLAKGNCSSRMLMAFEGTAAVPHGTHNTPDATLVLRCLGACSYASAVAIPAGVVPTSIATTASQIVALVEHTTPHVLWGVSTTRMLKTVTRVLYQLLTRVRRRTSQGPMEAEGVQ